MLFLRGFILQPTERAQVHLKNVTKDFQNSPPFERSACFYVIFSGNFERFQLFNFETDFLENENLFQKTGVCAFHFVEIFHWWKFGLYFVYIFIADWNFLIKFTSEISAHAQLCHYSFIHSIYKFHDMVLAGNSH